MANNKVLHTIKVKITELNLKLSFSKGLNTKSNQIGTMLIHLGGYLQQLDTYLGIIKVWRYSCVFALVFGQQRAFMSPAEMRLANIHPICFLCNHMYTT